MSFSCSQCNFKAQFESVLKMHQQLHHGSPPQDFINKPLVSQEKSSTLPRIKISEPPSGSKERKGFQLASSSSATKLFSKLRARITRSRARLSSHPEETSEANLDRVGNSLFLPKDITEMSDCTSKGLNFEATEFEAGALTALEPSQLPPQSLIRETYGCHLCSFETDRITVLDRHLLNDHKIGLETLLKLVMAKTKDGLLEQDTASVICGLKQPYYRTPDVIVDEELVIETVTPKIKILKHTGVNTDLQWTDIPELKDNCRIITKELEKLIKYPLEMADKNAFLRKMETLNECMCKFADSSNTLKKVIDSKISVRQDRNEHFFDLGLGEIDFLWIDKVRDINMTNKAFKNLKEMANQVKLNCRAPRFIRYQTLSGPKLRDSPRNWKRAHSEQMDRTSHKHRDNRGDKKYSSESFYF